MITQLELDILTHEHGGELPDDRLYLVLQTLMRELMDANHVGSDEFQRLWAEREAVKNRHGGMPPITEQKTTQRKET
jgi:hypothetical protein